MRAVWTSVRFLVWLAFAAIGAALPGLAVAGDVVVDNRIYEETGRMVLQNGELVVHLRPKPVPPKSEPAASAPQPPRAALVPALDKETGEAIAADMTSQASPGLTALGVSASAMSTPGTPREFGAALARGIDSAGNVKEGVALQFSPASLFTPYWLKGGSRFNHSAAMQAWARTSVELASAKSQDARIGQQLAASVSVGLIDQGDPRLYYRLLSDCTRDMFNDIGRPGESIDPELAKAELARAEKCYRTSWKATAASLWKAPRWYAGAARAWHTGDSARVSHAQAGASMLWTTYAQGFEALNPSGARFKTLVEFAASRRRKLLVEDPANADSLASESRTDASLRLRLSRDQWSGFADVGLARVRTGGILSDNVRHFGYGVEYKVNDSLWLVLASITERGFVSGDKRSLISTGLRFGQSEKSLIGAPAQGK